MFDLDSTLDSVKIKEYVGYLGGGIALFVQSLTQSRNHAIGIGAGILVVSYIANILSNLMNSLEYLRYVSPFHYYGGSDVLITGPYWVYILALSAASAALFILAIIIFSKRDTGI